MQTEGSRLNLRAVRTHEPEPLAEVVQLYQPVALRLAELPERDLQVMFEYFIEGHTQSQIAADHHMSPMQVTRWLTAALRRVRDLLA